MNITRVAKLKTAADLRAHLAAGGINLPFDEILATGPEAPLAQPYRLGDRVIGNRWCILPMEGWDGTLDGLPTELTCRRWHHFGISGAKLIWGGEAVAVRHDGRANPNQLLLEERTLPAIARLREELVEHHARACGRTDDLYVGLQLTHSGRFSRPNPGGKSEPLTLYPHPILDGRSPAGAGHLFTDDEIDRLVDDFILAGKRAAQAGYDFVDLKHCHGYLGHEFLSAVDRPGKYGGSLENRTRFLRNIVAGLRAEVPALEIGVRLSASDILPYRPGPEGTGEPEPLPPEEAGRGYRYAFGGDGTGAGMDLSEPRAFLKLLEELRIPLVCITIGSPYYNPHIQRPALFPPSDGYQPPEDPLQGVARQIALTAALKADFPNLAVVGSGYSYLQEWLPNVGQYVVRTGMADFVGLGRMVLSYPEMPVDVLAGRPLQRKKICRTFSDCTTGPRNGMVSGCYPLDEYYKLRPEAVAIGQLKKASDEG